MRSILYLAHAFPHTRGVKWVNSFKAAGVRPVVAYGYSGKHVWRTDQNLVMLLQNELARKFDPAPRLTARRLAFALESRDVQAAAIIVRDVFLSPTARALASKLGVPWYLDLCDNYPEVLRAQARGKRAWTRGMAPILDRLEVQAVTGSDATVFVTPESREYVMSKVRKRYGKAVADSAYARSFVIENAPIAAVSPTVNQPVGQGLVYVGTYDAHIRDLLTVVKGLKEYESRTGTTITVTLFTFNLQRVIDAFGELDFYWQKYVVFEEPVRADMLAAKLTCFLAGLVPHVASPAVDYTISNKIFDYLYAGIAVLASDNPPNVRLLEEVGAGLCYRREDANDFATVLGQLIRRRSSGDLDLILRALYPRYTWDCQAGEFIDFVVKTVGGHV